MTKEEFLTQFNGSEIYNLFDAHERPSKYVRDLSAFWTRLKKAGAVSAAAARGFTQAKKEKDDSMMIDLIEAAIWNAGRCIIAVNYSIGQKYCASEDELEEGRRFMEQLYAENGVSYNMDGPACL